MTHGVEQRGDKATGLHHKDIIKIKTCKLSDAGFIEGFIRE